VKHNSVVLFYGKYSWTTCELFMYKAMEKGQVVMFGIPPVPPGNRGKPLKTNVMVNIQF
jgi:hypothetical protein